MKEDAAFNVYFQDTYAEEKGPCWEYFFNILNTVYPEYLSKIMAHAAKMRFTAEGEDAKRHAIKATDEWYEALNNLPFKSSKFPCLLWFTECWHIEKKGKTLHLLKQSSKKIRHGKKKKVIPILGTIQAYHSARNDQIDKF